MGVIRAVRDPHNLSHSRVKSFFSCAARLGYESLYEGAKRVANPYWLAGGTAVHHIFSQILESTVAPPDPETGKTRKERQSLQLDTVDKVVDNARLHLSLVLDGKRPPRGFKDKPSRHLTIHWMSDEEKERRGQRGFEKFIQERKFKFINQVMPSIRAIALQCTAPIEQSPFTKSVAEASFDNRLFLTSPRDPQVKIPVWGSVDRTDWRKDGRIVVTDWKTGSFSYFLETALVGNDQMLVYWPGIHEIFGEYPSIAYFVSLNIYGADVEEHGAAALELDRYRVQAKIRYEEHAQEMINEFDDVWTVLTLLSHLSSPLLADADRDRRESFQPLSSMGYKMGIKRHLEQGRMFPSIGKQCATCTERLQCQADNPEDWQEYNILQKLGNVIDPLQYPEDWADPLRTEEDEAFSQQVLEEQISLLPKKPVRVSPLKNHNLKAAEWKDMGFLTPKEFTAQAKRMVEIIPVINGVVCPCKRVERINPCLMPHVQEFYGEREDYKRAQEAEGKTRSAEDPKDRVKELWDSEVVNEAIKHCCVPGCPHAKKDNTPEPPPED